jgi:hypothetical protein
MIGPGVYNKQCTKVLEETEAEGVVLLVIDGKHGSGFSCQGDLGIQLALPALLRGMADDIEEQHKKGRL